MSKNLPHVGFGGETKVFGSGTGTSTTKTDELRAESETFGG